MSYETWRKDALAHYVEMLDKAGPECAMYAADEAERKSEGVLSGLGAKVRAVIAERRVKRKEPA